MLKLKGITNFKALTLCTQYLAKSAKLIADNTVDGIENFNEAMADLAEDPDRVQSMLDMGLDVDGLEEMWSTIQSLVLYGHYLNLELIELLDPRTGIYPEGRHRQNATWKPGFSVTLTSKDRKAGWFESVKFLQDAASAPSLAGSYDDYLTTVDNPAFALTEDEWKGAQENSTILSDGDYANIVVDTLMNIGAGTDEGDFEDIPLRTQIYLIEKMRGKIDSISASAMKRAKSARGTAEEKLAEATKNKGLIYGMDITFQDMLGSARYAGLEEFMFTYTPTHGENSETIIESREMRTRQEIAATRSDQRRKLTQDQLDAIDAKEKAEEAARLAALTDPLPELVSSVF